MENVHTLQYTGKDGPIMQFWPSHQHEIFPGHSLNNGYHGMPPSAHIDGPLSWDTFAQLDERNGDVSRSKDWTKLWEWDSLSLSARRTTNGNNLQSGSHLQLVQGSEFNSPSPTDKFEANGGELTLLEFGLNSKTPAMNDDDSLLDLKLGGNSHTWGAGEVSPSSKRSRHSPAENQQTRCQVDNCTADLQNAKDYHRRHKVCEIHAKAPKAPVGRIMQRFCQQCSRFHLLKEFDDDRRSCRKRLAGHNRRRRKTQPDAATALACLLTDQNFLSRVINSAELHKGKDELEKLLHEHALLQTLLNARTAVGNAENKIFEGAPTNNLMNAISKSQLLGNLLLSNSTLGSNLPVGLTPTDALLSAVSNALLTSLPHLQQRNNGNVGAVSTEETGQLQGPYVNARNPHALAKQNTHLRYPAEEEPVSLAFPSSTERPLLPTTPPGYSDKSNESHGDSMDERPNLDSFQIYSREVQQDKRHLKNGNVGFDDALGMHSAGNHRITGLTQTRDFRIIYPDTTTPPMVDRLEMAGVGSDHSSDSSLDKQEQQTFHLWFKIFDKNPADLPSSLRKQMLEWLDHLPTDLEGYIKPGCIILTVFICMPLHAWEKLCRNIEQSLYKLVCISDSDFWRKGRVLAHFGEASAFIVDGKVYPNRNPKSPFTPNMILVQPFAIVVGETVDLTLRGHNLKAHGTKIVCAYEGKCSDKELALPSVFREKKRDRNEVSGLPLVGPDLQQEQVVTFQVGPFNNMGRTFIEVEGKRSKGNAFPIIIADRSICEEIYILENEYVRSLENNDDSAKISSGRIEADIIHFLHEFGWILQRVQWKVHGVDLKIEEFSSARYRWVLQYSVEHNCCSVVRRILDLLFTMDDSSMMLAHSRALNILSEANLLHVAVKSNTRAMVEFLLAYSPPISAAPANTRQGIIFRPDTSICDGFTPLHVAASMRSADGVMDALTNAPGEFWATAWTTAKDTFGQTPLMYALASGNHRYVSMVQGKLQKLGKSSDFKPIGTDVKLPHLALSIDDGNAKQLSSLSSPRKLPSTKQIQRCTCKGSENLRSQIFPLQVRGLNKGFMYRPFVLSMLAVAAVCVCVGVLMKGPPSVSFMQGPFVWESISFGSI